MSRIVGGGIQSAMLAPQNQNSFGQSAQSQSSAYGGGSRNSQFQNQANQNKWGNNNENGAQNYQNRGQQQSSQGGGRGRGERKEPRYGQNQGNNSSRGPQQNSSGNPSTVQAQATGIFSSFQNPSSAAQQTNSIFASSQSATNNLFGMSQGAASTGFGNSGMGAPQPAAGSSFGFGPNSSNQQISGNNFNDSDMGETQDPQSVMTSTIGIQGQQTNLQANPFIQSQNLPIVNSLFNNPVQFGQPSMQPNPITNTAIQQSSQQPQPSQSLFGQPLQQQNPPQQQQQQQQNTVVQNQPRPQSQNVPSFIQREEIKQQQLSGGQIMGNQSSQSREPFKYTYQIDRGSYEIKKVSFDQVNQSGRNDCEYTFDKNADGGPLTEFGFFCIAYNHVYRPEGEVTDPNLAFLPSKRECF